MELTISFRDAAHGAEKQIAFRRNGQREELKVKIPTGVDNGSKIRISGKGAQGEGGGSAGDLFLIIHVLPDPVFNRDGGDLFVERSIPFSAACLGISLDVPTLEGDKRIKIPAGIQPGTKIRLKGCGIKALGSNAKGDLYVKIGVHIPETLSGDQKKLMEELARNGL
jgi:curved DNA-binding protein